MTLDFNNIEVTSNISALTWFIRYIFLSKFTFP